MSKLYIIAVCSTLQCSNSTSPSACACLNCCDTAVGQKAHVALETLVPLLVGLLNSVPDLVEKKDKYVQYGCRGDWCVGPETRGWGFRAAEVVAMDAWLCKWGVLQQ